MPRRDGLRDGPDPGSRAIHPAAGDARLPQLGRARGIRAGSPPAVSRRQIPDEVLTAAHERAAAREARDWAEADRLRAEIEAAGWKIVDRGTDFALRRSRHWTRRRASASATAQAPMSRRGWRRRRSAWRRSCSWRLTGRTTWRVRCRVSPTTRPRARRSSSSRTPRPRIRRRPSRWSRRAAGRAACRPDRVDERPPGPRRRAERGGPPRAAGRS